MMLQLRYELYKLFARPRSWIGFGAFLAVQLLILGLLQLPRAQRAVGQLLERNGFGFESHYGGLTLAVVIIVFTFVLLGALYVALVAGDIVAKEVEEGAMRMVLCRPVSRVRLLTIKWLAVVIYTALLVLFLAATALAFATLYRGRLGDMFVFVPEEGLFAIYDTAEGLRRYGVAMVVLAYNTMTITSLAFMFSCFRMKPAAATILTLTVLFIDMVLQGIPYFADYRHWFVSYHTASWVRTFRDPVLWPGIVESMAYLAAINLSCFVIGVTRFCTRDLKS